MYIATSFVNGRGFTANPKESKQQKKTCAFTPRMISPCPGSHVPQRWKPIECHPGQFHSWNASKKSREIRASSRTITMATTGKMDVHIGTFKRFNIKRIMNSNGSHGSPGSIMPNVPQLVRIQTLGTWRFQESKKYLYPKKKWLIRVDPSVNDQTWNWTHSRIF